MIRIIAYAYEADIHCPSCARARFGVNPDSDSYTPSESDSNYIPFNVKDNEGNTIHPVFSTDETPADIKPENGGYDLCCGDCFVMIRENFYKQQEGETP